MAVQTVDSSSAGAQSGRECTRCRCQKSIDEFPWDAKREIPRPRCFDCENAVRRARYVPRGRISEIWWTPEQIAALRRARDVIEAAALTGRTVHACRRKAGDVGVQIPKRKAPGMRSKYAGTKLEAAVIEAAGKRIKFSVIAAQHGITKNVVAGIVWRWRKRNRS